MPGSMLHLILAKKTNPKGSPLFYLGNIAPDAVQDGHEKEITHFRNLPDRQAALRLLSEKTAGDFAEGILLHLFFDWKWDTGIRQKFIEQIGDDWFPAYRNELSLAGSYAYNHIDWAEKTWEDMYSVEINDYGVTPCASATDVKMFLVRNLKWHNENNTEPSPAFPPNLIESVTTEIAREYIEWRMKPFCLE